jgi:uncharacterized Zn-binding protein involved in type VI secretion
MACTVFANGDGFFHKGSGGSSQAFPDVCLSPPPPPAGPVPVPYPNVVQASDLADGSTTVKVQGNPTALEGDSCVSTSSGDEGGTQGGNVLTHKTKGKGYFQLWSFDVKVEGKGVCRHGDPMGQNCASTPFGGFSPKAMVAFNRAAAPDEPCDEPYNAKEHRPSMVQEQYDKVAPGPCWECKSPDPRGWKVPPIKKPPPPRPGQTPAGKTDKTFTPDHQPPAFVLWYMGLCKHYDDFKKQFQHPKNVKPHCRQCSDKQGGFSALSQQLRLVHGHG